MQTVTRKDKKENNGRRDFLKVSAQALAGIVGGGVVYAKSATPEDNKAAAERAASFPTKDYDWTKHNWAYGIDATRCIGCLRCVEACKKENDVVDDAYHFRTWVERYVYLEGDEHAHVDSHNDPDNIAASGAPGEYRFDNRYKDEKVEKAFFVPKMCNHCDRPSCVQVCPVGATYKAEDGTVLIDETYCIGCEYCVQACPYGARYFNHDTRTSDKCTWCYHRITKGLMPACVEVCPVEARIFGDLNDKTSTISKFVKNNRIQVLKPETGNAPQCFYVGIDKEVS
jgi:Fe-S-cluster-containing dehydrogenase component